MRVRGAPEMFHPSMTHPWPVDCEFEMKVNGVATAGKPPPPSSAWDPVGQLAVTVPLVLFATVAELLIVVTPS